MNKFEICARKKKLKKVLPVQLASSRTAFSSLNHRWENLTRLLDPERQVNRLGGEMEHMSSEAKKELDTWWPGTLRCFRHTQ